MRVPGTHGGGVVCCMTDDRRTKEPARAPVPWWHAMCDDGARRGERTVREVDLCRSTSDDSCTPCGQRRELKRIVCGLFVGPRGRRGKKQAHSGGLLAEPRRATGNDRAPSGRKQTQRLFSFPGVSLEDSLHAPAIGLQPFGLKERSPRHTALESRAT